MHFVFYTSIHYYSSTYFRYIFWIEQKTGVQRWFLDANTTSTRRSIKSSSLELTDIVVDITNGRIFWIDEKQMRISSVGDAGGDEVRLIVSSFDVVHCV